MIKLVDLTQIKTLVQGGIDLNQQNEKGETALSIGIKYIQSFPIISELILNGADVNSFDDLGNNAF